MGPYIYQLLQSTGHEIIIYILHRFPYKRLRRRWRSDSLSDKNEEQVRV